MTRIEELEMASHRAQLRADVARLVNKYRAIFGWDVPELDEALSDRLIFQAIQRALDDLQLPAHPT